LVSHWTPNRQVADSIPNCAASCAVSVVDALLRIPLDPCEPRSAQPNAREIGREGYITKLGATLVVAKLRAINWPVTLINNNDNNKLY
jgi:hypothetical protein